MTKLTHALGSESSNDVPNKLKKLGVKTFAAPDFENASDELRTNQNSTRSTVPSFCFAAIAVTHHTRFCGKSGPGAAIGE